MALILAACGSSAPSKSPPASSRPAASTKTASPSPAATPQKGKATAALIPIKYSMYFLPVGQDSPYYAAVYEGFYKKQGLSVKIVPGVSATDSTEWVGNGRVDITLDATSAAIHAISQGAPIKVVAVTSATNPVGLIYRSDKPIRKISDVYGKTIGVPPGTDAALVWQVFASQEHLNKARMHVVNTNPASQIGLLGKGKLDAIAAYGYSEMPIVKHLGIKAGFLGFAHFGVPFMAECIVTSDKMLKTHPNVVRKFLYATAQGWAFAKAHPNRAAADMHRAVPTLPTQVAVQALKGSFSYIQDRYSKGKPFGWSAPQDWNSELAELHKFGGVSKVLPISDYYTNAYLPTGSVSAP